VIRRFGAGLGPVVFGGVVLVVVSFGLLGGCTRHTAEVDRWRQPGLDFSHLGDRFISDSIEFTDQLNRAHQVGDFVAISESAGALILSLSDTVARMEALVPLVHPDLAPVAVEIAISGRAWTEAAATALRAGLAADPALFAETRGVLNREREKFNLGIRKWNLAIEDK
jgi:hypothetical protein